VGLELKISRKNWDWKHRHSKKYCYRPSDLSRNSRSTKILESLPKSSSFQSSEGETASQSSFGSNGSPFAEKLTKFNFAGLASSKSYAEI
jgi:hypothetical protein